MKNKILFLGLLLLLSFTNVKASYTTTRDKCIDEGTCLVICNYTNVEKTSSSVEGSIYSGKYDAYILRRYVTIYYDLKNEQFGVGFWSGGSATGKGARLKTDPDFSKVFSTNGTNVFIQSRGEPQTFTCPQNGYFDMNDWFGGNEVCFDNDGSWCANQSNSHATFGTATSSFLDETRDMTFEDEVNTYFSTGSLGDITIDDFISGKYKDGNDVLEKIVKTDFKTHFLHGYNLPDFIKNSNAYKNGLEKIMNNYNEMVKKWQTELDEKKENGTITEEEYNEITKNIAEMGTEIEENGQEALDNIDVIDNQEDLGIVDVDFCSQYDENGNPNHTLLVFQVIGYIIVIIKILVPIILIILGSIDLGKASISQDEKALKDAVTKFCKRILIGLIIFFIPTILDFFLSLVSGVSETASDFEPCTDCLLNPDDPSKCSPKKLNET